MRFEELKSMIYSILEKKFIESSPQIYGRVLQLGLGAVEGRYCRGM